MSSFKSTKLRERVHERCGYRCWYCGKLLGEYVELKDAPCIDHQIPLVRGGDNSETNLVTACRACNSQKKDRTVEEYRAYISPANRAAALLEESMAIHSTPFDEQVLLALRWLLQRDKVEFYGERRR